MFVQLEWHVFKFKCQLIWAILVPYERLQSVDAIIYTTYTISYFLNSLDNGGLQRKGAKVIRCYFEANIEIIILNNLIFN